MTSPQTFSPVKSVDPAIVQAAFNEWRGKPASSIQTQRDSVERDMARAFEQAGPDFDLEKIDCIGGNTLAEKAENLVEIHSRLSGLEDALAERTELDKVAQDIRNGNRGGGPTEAAPAQPVVLRQPRPPRISDHVYRDLRERGLDLVQASRGGGLSIESQLPGNDILNTLFQTTDGWAPEVIRDPGYVVSPQRPVQVTDIIPRSVTTQNAVKFMKETTFTNAAAETSEAALAPEATLKVEEQDMPISKIAVSIPTTEEELADEPQSRFYLDDRLMFMMRQHIDKQILLGDGTAPNLTGVLDYTASDEIQTESWTHGTGDALSKPMTTMRLAKTKVALGGRAMASHFVMHHTTWDEVATSESSAGGYYLGNPMADFSERIWGLPVVLCDALSDGTAEDDVNGLVGDFRNFANLRVRRDFLTEVGVSNDDFLKGILRIRGTVRVALVIYRPQAFCKIDRPA